MKIRFEIKLFLIISIIFMNKIRSQNKKAIEIIGKSLIAHGFEPNAIKIKKIKYLKTTISYNNIGEPNKEIKQSITHQFDPFMTQIISNNKLLKTNGINTEVIINGILLNDLKSSENAKSILDGAFYVFWQPMKLKDPGTILKYLGEDFLPNKKKVHVINVSYPNGKDTWKFYFDTTTFLLIATEVNHNNKISLIYTSDFNITKHGIFHHRRESYNVTENRSKLILQASYVYDIKEVVN